MHTVGQAAGGVCHGARHHRVVQQAYKQRTLDSGRDEPDERVHMRALRGRSNHEFRIHMTPALLRYSLAGCDPVALPRPLFDCGGLEPTKFPA